MVCPSYRMGIFGCVDQVAKFGPRNLDILNYTLLLGSPVALWILIDLDILKGTEGPNRYGPDPFSQPSPTQ